MILGCYNFVSALEYERLKKDLREENRDKVYQGPPPPPPPIEIPPLSLAGALSGAFLLVGGGGGDGGGGGGDQVEQKYLVREKISWNTEWCRIRSRRIS